MLSQHKQGAASQAKLEEMPTAKEYFPSPPRYRVARSSAVRRSTVATQEAMGRIPIVQSHNSKVTAQQCMSMNPNLKETSDISSFALPSSYHSSKPTRSITLARGAHRSSLFTIADAPPFTAMERSLIHASQNCLFSNESMVADDLSGTYSAFLDFTRVRYPGMAAEELKQAKSEVVVKHKMVCGFHRKLIWLSLG